MRGNASGCSEPFLGGAYQCNHLGGLFRRRQFRAKPGVHEAHLYTQPEHVCAAFERLRTISPRILVAAAFGNVHGVYKPGNVKLRPSILDDSQKFIEKRLGTPPRPVNFVFHGGSGSSREEIREAISGNLCRCTGYGLIIESIRWAAEKIAQQGGER